DASSLAFTPVPHRDLATVGLHNLLHNRQSKARALFSCCYIGLCEPFPLLRRQTTTVVLDYDVVAFFSSEQARPHLSRFGRLAFTPVIHRLLSTVVLPNLLHNRQSTARALFSCCYIGL